MWGPPARGPPPAIVAGGEKDRGPRSLSASLSISGCSSRTANFLVQVRWWPLT